MARNWPRQIRCKKLKKDTHFYTNMKDMEEHLSAKQFIRVHKSFIISIPKLRV